MGGFLAFCSRVDARTRYGYPFEAKSGLLAPRPRAAAFAALGRGPKRPEKYHQGSRVLRVPPLMGLFGAFCSRVDARTRRRQPGTGTRYTVPLNEEVSWHLAFHVRSACCADGGTGTLTRKHGTPCPLSTPYDPLSRTWYPYVS